MNVNLGTQCVEKELHILGVKDFTLFQRAHQIWFLKELFIYNFDHNFLQEAKLMAHCKQ